MTKICMFFVLSKIMGYVAILSGITKSYMRYQQQPYENLIKSGSLKIIKKSFIVHHGSLFFVKKKFAPIYVNRQIRPH